MERIFIFGGEEIRESLLFSKEFFLRWRCFPIELIRLLSLKFAPDSFLAPVPIFTPVIFLYFYKVVPPRVLSPKQNYPLVFSDLMI